MESSHRKPLALISRIAMLTMIGLLFWCGCASRVNPTPERTFTTMELLISLSDMPPSWTGGIGQKLKKGADYLSTQDSAFASFKADAQSPDEPARQFIYRYDSSTKAQKVYEDLVLPSEVGKTPTEWTYRSPIANQSRFVCYDYEGREPYSICKWSARYEEYVVTFHSWMIPGRMSLQDMERAIKAIDARMARYLGKP